MFKEHLSGNYRELLNLFFFLKLHDCIKLSILIKHKKECHLLIFLIIWFFSHGSILILIKSPLGVSNVISCCFSVNFSILDFISCLIGDSWFNRPWLITETIRRFIYRPISSIHLWKDINFCTKASYKTWL